MSVQGQPFTVEFVVSDTTNTRRRLILSSSFTEARVTPLHCQVGWLYTVPHTLSAAALPLSTRFSATGWTLPLPPVQIPFAAVARDTWLNLTIPMAEIMSLFFK